MKAVTYELVMVNDYACGMNTEYEKMITKSHDDDVVVMIRVGWLSVIVVTSNSCLKISKRRAPRLCRAKGF
jgi:hypothetical protein